MRDKMELIVEKFNKKEFWRGWHDGRYGVSVGRSICSQSDTEDYNNGWQYGYIALLTRGRIEEGDKIG